MSLEEGSLGVLGWGTGIQVAGCQSVMFVSEWVMSREAVGRGRRRRLVDVGAAAEMLQDLCCIRL